MKFKILLLLFSIFTLISFILLTSTVSRRTWHRIDFDTVVKLQDHIPRKLDAPFTFLSLLGSAEVMSAVVAGLIIFNLIKFRIIAVLGWLMMFPASVFELYGKLQIYHPGTPVFLHRAVNLGAELPSFYVQTDYSYPSGHMIRTVFVATIIFITILVKRKNDVFKYSILSLIAGYCLLMALTRVYLAEHWLSDVIGGSLLGVSFGSFSAILVLYSSRAKKVLQED